MPSVALAGTVTDTLKWPIESVVVLVTSLKALIEMLAFETGDPEVVYKCP